MQCIRPTGPLGDPTWSFRDPTEPFGDHSLENSNLNVSRYGLAGISLTTLTTRSPDGDNNNTDDGDNDNGVLVVRIANWN